MLTFPCAHATVCGMKILRRCAFVVRCMYMQLRCRAALVLIFFPLSYVGRSWLARSTDGPWPRGDGSSENNATLFVACSRAGRGLKCTAKEYLTYGGTYVKREKWLSRKVDWDWEYDAGRRGVDGECVVVCVKFLLQRSHCISYFIFFAGSPLLRMFFFLPLLGVVSLCIAIIASRCVHVQMKR